MTDTQSPQAAFRERLLLLVRQGPATSQELANATGKSRSRVRNILEWLESQGLVYGTMHRHGSARFIRWHAQKVIQPPKLEPVCLKNPHRDPLVAALFGPTGTSSYWEAV